MLSHTRGVNGRRPLPPKREEPPRGGPRRGQRAPRRREQQRPESHARDLNVVFSQSLQRLGGPRLFVVRAQHEAVTESNQIRDVNADAYLDDGGFRGFTLSRIVDVPRKTKKVKEISIELIGMMERIT